MDYPDIKVWSKGKIHIIFFHTFGLPILKVTFAIEMAGDILELNG
jgi:hypothetical protein